MKIVIKNEDDSWSVISDPNLSPSGVKVVHNVIPEIEHWNEVELAGFYANLGVDVNRTDIRGLAIIWVEQGREEALTKEREKILARDYDWTRADIATMKNIKLIKNIRLTVSELKYPSNHEVRLAMVNSPNFFQENNIL